MGNCNADANFLLASGVERPIIEKNVTNQAGVWCGRTFLIKNDILSRN